MNTVQKSAIIAIFGRCSNNVTVLCGSRSDARCGLDAVRTVKIIVAVYWVARRRSVSRRRAYIHVHVKIKDSGK